VKSEEFEFQLQNARQDANAASNDFKDAQLNLVRIQNLPDSDPAKEELYSAALARFDSQKETLERAKANSQAQRNLELEARKEDAGLELQEAQNRFQEAQEQLRSAEELPEDEPLKAKLVKNKQASLDTEKESLQNAKILVFDLNKQQFQIQIEF